MSDTSLSRRALFGTALLSALLLAGTTQAASDPEAFVTSVGNNVLDVARQGSEDGFRSLLRANADVETIAVFSLGAYRKNLSAGQKPEYVSLVEAYISRVFTQNAQRLAGKSIEVTGSQKAADSVIVKSNLRYDDGHSVPVVWRLVNRGGSYKIFDVNVDGIWLATTQKTNFVAVLKQNNGNIDALLAYLKQ